MKLLKLIRDVVACVLGLFRSSRDTSIKILKLTYDIVAWDFPVNFPVKLPKEPSMNLFDLPNDVLALMVDLLTYTDQLALRPLCREARDLTEGAAMANRLANALFPLTVVQPIAGKQKSLATIFRSQSQENPCCVFLRRTASSNYQASSKVEEGVLLSAYISCSEVKRPTHVAAAVDMQFSTFIQTPAQQGTLKGAWKEDMVRLRFKGTVEDVVRVKLTVEDVVRVHLNVTPKHVSATVAFRQGFAQRRAPFVGKVLGQVMKDFDASNANLLTQAFATCEDAGKASLLSQAFANSEDAPSKVVGLKPNGQVPVGSFEDGRLRILIRRRYGREDRQVDLSVL